MVQSRAWGALCLAAVVCLAPACGAEEPEGGDSPTLAQGSSAPRSADVRVGLTEWTIALSRSRVTSGRLTLEVTNAGGTLHDLIVRGEDGQWHTDDLRPGEQQRLVVSAAPGETLELWCSEPGHATQGMRTSLPVGG